jgi:copper chaperone NosL
MRKAFLLFFIGMLCWASPLWATEPQLPGPKDRCPICGMFVAPYPNWTSTILFKDGSQLFFDGAKDLYRYTLADHKPEHGGIAAIYLTDYYSTQLLPAEELFLILGSDVFGPMGHEFVPIAGEEAAKTFAKDHKGQKILKFDQLTPKMIPAD